MEVRKTMLMTNQEKLIHYYEENLSKADTKPEVYNLAVNTWRELHKCDPPYSNFNSFKVAYSIYKNQS